jgi:signal transduction histidine kinase
MPIDTNTKPMIKTLEGIRSMFVTLFQLVRHRSLTRRMLLAQMIGCGLTLAALFVVLWYLAILSARTSIDRTVEQFCLLLLNVQDPGHSAQRLITNLSALADSTKGSSPQPRDEVRFELRDARGMLLAASTSSPGPDSSAWKTNQLRDPETGRTVIVAVSRPFVERLWKEEALRQMSCVSLAMLVLVVPVLLIATIVLTQLGLTPLRTLGRSIAERSPDNLTPITSSHPYPELTPLLNELNRLLERLREAQAVERRFFTDAAHELLTPIAALRAQTHLLATAPDEPAKATARSDVESGLVRAAAMIRQLLMIARISSADCRVDLQLQNLVPLVQERLGVTAPRALDKGIELDLQAPQECQCVFDAGTMASVLDNVIDNAIRYVQPGARIRVKLRRYATAVWIAVADNGPGIAAEYREKVFERFFRVPGNAQTGSGLGLAIVARIVALHQGIVVLQKGIGSRGLMVCIRLPVAQQP